MWVSSAYFSNFVLEKDFCISGVEGMPNCQAPTQNQDFGLEMG